ncbi:hypothetical protein SELMODRAFT_418499 [Selaginella moellendorffii]|uniref:Uncharacterized protein n=1 Tax=Selaginella moellendorffii TaxID=88036 RepID=D8S5X1_SELML|nr:hypothetical protein SELMODRAFT_418499 [Selaginella moellendorffii]
MVWVWGSGIQHRGVAHGVRSNCGGGAFGARGRTLGPAVTRGGKLPRGRGHRDAELANLGLNKGGPRAGAQGAIAWGTRAWGAGSFPMASRTQLFSKFSSTTTSKDDIAVEQEVEEDDGGDEEEGDDDEERERKTRNPDYFSLSHEDVRWLMPVKLNLKVFPIEYFNIMDEFLAKQASTSPTFLLLI